MSSQTENGNSEDLDKYARLLYDAAIIGEGEAIDDPRDFADRLVDVMEAALKQK
jgi:HSP90 family molecular chaperone